MYLYMCCVCTRVYIFITGHLLHKKLSIGNAIDVIFFEVLKTFDTFLHFALLQKISYLFGVVGKEKKERILTMLG